MKMNRAQRAVYISNIVYLCVYCGLGVTAQWRMVIKKYTNLLCFIVRAYSKCVLLNLYTKFNFVS